MDSFDQRVKSFQAGLVTTQANINRLQEKEKNLATFDQRADGLEKRVTGLAEQAAELEKQQTDLETLRERLVQVDELTTRTGYQFETLEKSRGELEAVRAEITEFHQTRGEVAKMVAALAADKETFEGFLVRTDEFRRQIPVLDSKMDAITSKLGVVEEGGQKVAAVVAVAADLDRQMTHIGGHQQLVEKTEARLNTLHELTTGVDAQMQEQLSRRAEIESLKSLCDGLAIQAIDVRQQADGIASTQQKLLPLTTQVSDLKRQVDKTGALFLEVKQDEETIRTQEKRLAELLEQGRQAADTAEERVRQVQELTTELHTGSTMKDELSAELSRVQARQREVTEQTQLTEDQVHRVEEQMKRLDQRRSQVAFADKKLVAFEGRLGEFSVMSSEVDRQIQALESRQTLVGSVKREVDEVQQISGKSKADLQHVVEHRGEVDALRARVEEALRGIGETEDRVGVIEAKRKVVDDVHRKTNAIVHLLEDVRVNLEMVSEQKAVIDHVVENVATLDETLRAAQATQRSLRVERELAERIERGIKSLRTKIGTTDTRDEEEQTA